MRLVQYVASMRDGHIHAGGEFEVVKEAAAFAVIDGHFNFGQVTMRKALALGIEKAKETGTATVFVRNCNHVGRLGAYTEEAARNGLAAVMAVNAPGPGGVAPFGGIDRKLGTNPISMAAPSTEAPLVLDMTTSATAERPSTVCGRSLGKPGGQPVDTLGQAPPRRPAGSTRRSWRA
jgi:hydroxycarboxylate dehydrogenase B